MNPCPGLFNPIIAKDGILSRLRVPGGILNFAQCQAIANLTDSIQITNRANLQIRGRGISTKNLTQLQSLGLATFDPDLDSIRNIMCSPTAGIDQQSSFDLLPLVKEWNAYLSSQAHLRILSAKFSVGFDGGEVLSISDRNNDLLLVTEKLINQAEIYLRLYICDRDRQNPVQDTSILVKSSEAIQLLAALTEVYFHYSQSCLNSPYSSNSHSPSSHSLKPHSIKLPRLRQLIEDWGIEEYLSQVAKLIPFSLIYSQSKPKSKTLHSKHHLKSQYLKSEHLKSQHIGIHDQSQPGSVYIGVVVPLGHLSSQHFSALAAIACDHGKSEIRLTPWQNLLIPHISRSQIEVVKNKILELGLSISASHPYARISACIGSQGCSASASDTHLDAQAIALHMLESSHSDDQENSILDSQLQLINIDLTQINPALIDQAKIHLSGCAKLCAQNDPSDLTLIAIAPHQYQVLESTAKKC
jgi:ferredoxin-nitrite reductase